jgi:hypothetical protein
MSENACLPSCDDGHAVHADNHTAVCAHGDHPQSDSVGSDEKSAEVKTAEAKTGEGRRDTPVSGEMFTDLCISGYDSNTFMVDYKIDDHDKQWIAEVILVSGTDNLDETFYQQKLVARYGRHDGKQFRLPDDLIAKNVAYTGATLAVDVPRFNSRGTPSRQYCTVYLQETFKRGGPYTIALTASKKYKLTDSKDQTIWASDDEEFMGRLKLALERLDAQVGYTTLKESMVNGVITQMDSEDEPPKDDAKRMKLEE